MPDVHTDHPPMPDVQGVRRQTYLGMVFSAGWLVALISSSISPNCSQRSYWMLAVVWGIMLAGLIGFRTTLNASSGGDQSEVADVVLTRKLLDIHVRAVWWLMGLTAVRLLGVFLFNY